MKIYILEDFSEEVRDRLDTLLHSLEAKAPKVKSERLKALLGKDDFKLFVAESENGEIAGMLTLTCCSTLSRSKYWIEDVVVDERFRGQGLGRALVKAALASVEEDKDDHVIYLTSNPSRTAARHLYRSEGFKEYNTGVFRIMPD